MPIIICAICSKEFSVLPYRKDTAIYCSRSCQNIGTFDKREDNRINAITGHIAWNNNQLTKICFYCDDEFKCSPSRINRKFCSQWCHYSFKSDHIPPRKYIRITVNGIRILEHHHVVEQSIGRKLTPDETIDHINRNRQDNRLENLRILSREEHGKVSASYQHLPAPWRERDVEQNKK